jgi:hypothetical protein
MRTKVRSLPPEVALNRVLAGLEKELVDVTDDEITQAAADLGMNLAMKGSAAFIGVKYTFPKRAGEIFAAEELRRFYVEYLRTRQASLPKAGRKARDDEGGED